MSLLSDRQEAAIASNRALFGRARAIANETAEKHQLRLGDMIGPSRLRPINHARQEAMWRMRHETRMSLPQIAAAVGRGDHTTVLHGVRAHEKRMAEAQA